MWNIDFSSIESDNCWDGAMTAFLNYYGYNYHILEMNRLVVKYFTNCCDYLEDCLYSHYLNQDILLLKRYYHIEIERHKPDIHTHSLLQAELVKAPVGVWLDTYYCSWLPFYKRLHQKHYCLIVNWEGENNQYVCRDIYYNKLSDIPIAQPDFLRAYLGCYCYRFHGCNHITPYILVDVLRTSLQKIEIQKLHQEREAFKQYIHNQFSLQKQKKRIDSIESSILLLRFLWLIDNKKSFARGLRYLQTQFPWLQFDAVCEGLSQQAILFSTIRNTFIKGFITNKFSISHFAKLFDMIYQLDIIVIQRLSAEIGAP